MDNNLNFRIGGLQKTSLLDFPDKVSAIVFTQGCNFNCGFCHNPALLKINALSPLSLPYPAGGEGADIGAGSFFNFLKTRRGKLDGVVITGGEPCLQPDLKAFIQEIKETGFLVKLDTNGSFPDVLENLLNENLLDYTAMDIKAPLEKYETVINARINIDKIKKSIDLIMNAGIDYEFRTTFMPHYHKMEDFEKIGALIKGARKYYLQKFEARTEINNPALKDEKNYSDADIQKIIDILKTYVQNVILR